jgi:hypothetical protein
MKCDVRGVSSNGDYRLFEITNLTGKARGSNWRKGRET